MSTLTAIVREIFDRTLLTKRVTALTGGTNAIAAVVITNGGTGYDDTFSVTFTGGGGSGAAATATAVDGVIVSVEITNPGTGYTSAPTPNFSAGGGSDAASTALLAAETLDAIPTEELEPGTITIWVIISNTIHIYSLIAGTDAESTPTFVRPDDYATTTNEKVWGLRGLLVGAGGLALDEGANISAGTSTGSQIGTGASQKLGFWGVTPVVQPAHADQAAVTLGNTNGEIAGLTFSNPPTQAECQALRDACEELADDLRALSTLLHALRSSGVATGIWKGAA
ncbi:MAG TPA: hypothetical protein PKA41_10220 [Verrucomicrobiota bacterium]|nr:hypothetical protein [Verrucomicrobiota bacterium]